MSTKKFLRHELFSSWRFFDWSSSWFLDVGYMDVGIGTENRSFSRARWSGKTRLRQTLSLTLSAAFLSNFSKFCCLVSNISIHKHCLQKGSDPNHFSQLWFSCEIKMGALYRRYVEGGEAKLRMERNFLEAPARIDSKYGNSTVESSLYSCPEFV